MKNTNTNKDAQRAGTIGLKPESNSKATSSLSLPNNQVKDIFISRCSPFGCALSSEDYYYEPIFFQFIHSSEVKEVLVKDEIVMGD